MNFPIPFQTRLRTARAAVFVSFVPRWSWWTLVFVGLAVALLANTARADLLVLQPGGASGRGVFGEVARFDAGASPMLARGFRPDNEGCNALWTGTDGTVYVAANLVGYGIVYRYASNGTLLSKIADVPGVQFLGGVTAPDGSVFLLAAATDVEGVTTRAIWRGDANGRGAPGPFLGVAQRVSEPTAMALGPDGNLYVADAHAGLLRFDAATGMFRDVFLKRTIADASATTAMAFGPDGALYLANAGDNAIVRVALDAGAGGPREVFIDAVSAGPRSVAGLAFGPGGDLFVTDAMAGVVLRFAGATGEPRGVFAHVGPQRATAISSLAFVP